MSGPDTTGTTASPGDEPVGTVAEEAFKLFQAVASPAAADGSTDAGHVCTTTWCPVCRIAGFVHDNPDAIASVTRSATDLARSLRDLVDSALAPQEKQ